MKKEIQLSDHFDYIKMIKFTLPTMCTMIVSSIFGSVDDGFFVSNFAGKDAFAAINIVIPALMIIASFGWMMGTGGSALVSKLLGQNKKEKANELFTFFVCLIFIFGIIVSFISYIFAKDICLLLGASSDILEKCIIYGQICLFFQPFYLIQNCMQSFLVVAEKPKVLFYVQISVGVVNTFLDFLLVYYFRLGVVGAALATGGGQLVGGLIPVIFFLTNKDLTINFVKFKIDIPSLLKAISNGTADMITNVSMSIVGIFMNLQLIKYLGNDGVVIYGVIMYVCYFFIGIFVGYSIGIAPVFSFHYGAENHDELKSLFKKSIIFLTITSIVLTLLSFLVAKPLAMIFLSYDQKLLNMTIHGFILYSISYLIAHINIFSGSFFSALNCGKVSAFISFARTFVLQIICIYLVPYLIGIDGLWLAIVASEGLTLPICIYFLITRRKEFHYV